MDRWIPRALDSVNGGFHENYAEDWSEQPDKTRSLVYLARMIWLAATGGNQEAVDHGFKTLWEKFWDDDYGGFYWMIGVDNELVPDPEKHLYGQAFAVYAMAKAGKLNDALWAFQWFDLHAHDDENGGYVETLWSDGEKRISGEGEDSIGTPYGLKSMNTHLHILEALIELYSATKDSKVRSRLEEVFEIFTTRYMLLDGRLVYYATQDYHQASEVDSYGHAMEAAFLAIEAAEVLELKVEETWELARRMVDRCLEVGWDDRYGGMYNEGHFDKPPDDMNKIWWVQAESYNALRLMANRYGSPYESYRDRQLRFIADHQIDPVHGGWFPTVNHDGSPVPGHIKSDAWTEGYHQGRAIILAQV